MTTTAMNNFQFAPLRSLDDFLLESARFQVPNFSDFEKWGNRVVKNLLYYQTNYFILAAIELIIIGLVQPQKIVLGFSALAAVGYAMLMIYGPNKSPATQQLQNVNKYAVLGLLFGVVYIFLYMFDAVLLVAFAVLLPISSE
jgi:PRA1 family protein 3